MGVNAACFHKELCMQVSILVAYDTCQIERYTQHIEFYLLEVLRLVTYTFGSVLWLRGSGIKFFLRGE